MRHGRMPARQPGQVAVIMAVAMTALLSMTALGVDLGYGYAHRRAAQNAADAAALAGVQQLSRHYQYSAYLAKPVADITLGVATTADKTNGDVLLDMTKATLANLPNFPGPDTVTNTRLPEGIQLVAEYIDPAGALTIIPGGGAVTATPPAASDPVGVKATVGYDSPTFFAKVFGLARLHVQAEAYAKMFKAAPADSGGPFVVCGRYRDPVQNEEQGAYLIKAPATPSALVPPPTPLTSAQIVPLLSGTPPRVDYAQYTGAWFLIHGAQLPRGVGTGPSAIPADCGRKDNAWKGAATEGAPCVPLAPPEPLPCRQEVDNGNRAGPLRNRVNGLPGCNPTEANRCVVFLPISDGVYSPIEMHIVDYAPFWIIPDTPAGAVDVGGCAPSNCHSGELLPQATCGAGCVPTGAFNPSDPYGLSTFKLVQSATSTS